MPLWLNLDWLPFEWWWLSAAVFGVCLLARIVAHLRHDAATRRRIYALAAEHGRFVDAARRANREHLELLPAEQRRSHARAFVHGLPVRTLGQAPGIEPLHLDRIEKAGLLRLGEVAEAELMVELKLPLRVFESIHRFINEQIRTVEARAERSLEVQPNVTVASRFGRYGRQVRERGAEMELDRRQFAELLAALDRHPGRSLGARARSFFRAGLEAVKPRRMVVWLLQLGVLACVCLGAAWLAGRFGLPVPLEAGVALAFVMAHLVQLLNIVVNERLVFGRRPDPTHFAELRVEAQAAKLAMKLGMSPPRIRISEGSFPRTRAIGRGGGPACLVLDAELLQILDPEATKALLGLLLEQLRADTARWRGTHALLFMPFLLLRRLSLLALGYFAVRARYHVHPYLEGTQLRPRRDPTALIYAAAALPFALLALLVSAVYWPLEGLAGFAAHLEGHRGAARAVELSGDVAHLRAALQMQSDRLVSPLHRHQRMPGGRPRLRLIKPERRFAGAVERLEARLGLNGPSPAAQVMSSSRLEPLIALLLSVAGVALLYALTLAPAGLEGLRKAPPPKALLSLVLAQNCHLRAGPKKAAKSLGVQKAGTRCEALGKDVGKWRNLRCGTREGFAHAVCLKAPKPKK